MRKLFILLIVVGIIALAVFTGSWILDVLSSVFNFIGYCFEWLAKIFNWFGWNKGIL